MSEPVKIALPSRLEPVPAVEFIKNLWQNIDAELVQLDFSSLGYSFPFGLSVVASEIKRFVKTRPPKSVTAVGINSSGNAAHSYISHIGFFEHIGIHVGNQPGQASGSQSYMPITVLTRSNLVKRLARPDEPIAKAVNAEAQRLAILITQQNDLTKNRPVAYCLRETIRNTFEHGETDISVLSAQKWYDGDIEIAIVDRGRGIRESLSEHISTENDCEALNLAIQPGVSRSIDNSTDNEWGNSGFGLYVLSELGKRYGAFYLISGDSFLIAKDGVIDCIDCTFQGTAVGLRVKKPKGTNFQQLIESIVEDGEKISASSQFPRRASKSSKTS